MKIQRLYSYVRRAVDDFQMIADGDKIAVGMSGGKDSLTLLYALAGLRHFYPKKFDIMAVTVDLGFDEFNFEDIQMICEGLQVKSHIIKTRIGQIVFKERKEASPCAICAKMRKGALNDYVKNIGYNKVAYAHHMDDMIETMLLSLFYEGRFYSFAPVTKLDRTGLEIIRPLMYVPEADVKGFVNKYQLSVIDNPCPADSVTRRAYIKTLLQQINRENPGVKTRLFHAIAAGFVHPDAE